MMWRLYGEFADGSTESVTGKTENDCFRKLLKIAKDRGELQDYESLQISSKLYFTAKMVKMICVVITIISLLWIAVSYAEILSQNLGENPVYHGWNMFVAIRTIIGG